MYEHYENSEEKRIEEIYNELFPIKGWSYIGVGEREPWMDSFKKLGLNDIGATGHIIEGIANGFSLVRAQPKEISSRILDFKNNLYLAGGPVPNAYARDVLYGKAISYDEEPDWYICDGNGNEIKGATPKIKNGVLIKDSFMIIKCRNMHGKNVKSAIFAGCHGPGTSAAGALMKNKEIMEHVYSEVEDNDFQLIGQVPIEHKLYEYGKLETLGEIKKKDIIDIRQLF